MHRCETSNIVHSNQSQVKNKQISIPSQSDASIILHQARQNEEGIKVEVDVKVEVKVEVSNAKVVKKNNLPLNPLLPWPPLLHHSLSTLQTVYPMEEVSRPVTAHTRRNRR